MRKNNQAFLFLILILMLGLNACNVPVATATPSSTNEDVNETKITPANTPEPSTPTPEPTPTPVVDTSLYTPEIVSATSEVIYEQNQRATLGKTNTFFWPDGNIGFVPLDDGQFRFFAANSTRTAVSVGTLDDPGAVVENHKLVIEGVDPRFAYAAGGPIYRDPESGLLLMFYHAERHFGGSGLIFHAAIGLAASQDEGATFQNLGIILENNAPPDRNAPCCADMGGATYTIKDGNFLVYFRDRQEDLSTVELAVATAPVDEVVEAAKNGTTSPWFKYDNGSEQSGIMGTSSPLEIGNPPTDWFSVSYNTFIDRYVMAILTHVRSDTNNYQLYLTTSEDGYIWSPRVLLTEFHGEMAYPTIIDPAGDPLNTSQTFYIYYVTTPVGITRWHDTTFHRMTVTLSGEMLEPKHGWEFDTDPEGWTPLWDMAPLDVQNGALVIQATGGDPYMLSPSLAVNGDTYKHIEVRMKVGEGGVGQFFFTTQDIPSHVEEASVVFPVEASDEYVTYTVDMSESPAWQGRIGNIRFDPINQATSIAIDYIRLIP